MPVTRFMLQALAVSGGLGLAALVGGAGGAGEQAHKVMPSEKVTFAPGPATLPEGAQVAVLFGSPAEEGPFVIRLKFPAGYEVPPHSHSKEEHVTVISGTLGMNAGETLNREDSHILSAGSFVRMPAGQPHYAWTDEETVLQINGMGPFDITYVDESQDPRVN